MRVVTFVCSDSFSIDQATNRLSLFHIIDRISAPSFPVVIPGMALCAVWERDQHDPITVEYDMKIMLDAQHLAKMTGQIDFRGHDRARAVGKVQGFRLPNPGRIKILIEVGGVELAKWEMDAQGPAAPTTRATDTPPDTSSPAPAPPLALAAAPPPPFAAAPPPPFAAAPPREAMPQPPPSPAPLLTSAPEVARPLESAPLPVPAVAPSPEPEPQPAPAPQPGPALVPPVVPPPAPAASPAPKPSSVRNAAKAPEKSKAPKKPEVRAKSGARVKPGMRKK
jgi:hypothetical protein